MTGTASAETRPAQLRGHAWTCSQMGSAPKSLSGSLRLRAAGQGVHEKAPRAGDAGPCGRDTARASHAGQEEHARPRQPATEQGPFTRQPCSRKACSPAPLSPAHTPQSLTPAPCWQGSAPGPHFPHRHPRTCTLHPPWLRADVSSASWEGAGRAARQLSCALILWLWHRPCAHHAACPHLLWWLLWPHRPRRRVARVPERTARPPRPRVAGVLGVFVQNHASGLSTTGSWGVLRSRRCGH